MLTASFGDVDPERLFDMGLDAAASKRPDLQAWLGLDAHAHHRPAAHDRTAHDAEISCFAILREAPIRAVTLTLLLEILAEHCGGDLLRLKGIVNIAESPDRPAVIHGVQHVFHPPAWLERWPSADRRSRLVFIVRDIPQAWIEALLGGARGRGRRGDEKRHARVGASTTHSRPLRDRAARSRVNEDKAWTGDDHGREPRARNRRCCRA